jgi:PAS domain S-box-containing protein
MENISESQSSTTAKTGKTMEERLKKSEEKYRLLAEHVKDHVWLLDMNLKPAYASPSAEKASGYTFAELEELSLDKVLTAESLQKALEMFSTEMLNAAINPPPPDYKRSLEVEFRCKDGHLIWVEATVSFLQDENGKPLFVLGESRNITERRNAESQKEAALEELRHSEEKYRSILENIREAYFEADLAGNFTFFNDSFCRILGYSREEMMGMNYRQYTDKENSKIIFQEFNKVYRTGESAEAFDWQMIRKDGVKIYVEESISLKKDLSGEITGFRGVVRDITERKKFEKSLKKSEEQYRLLADHMKDYVWLMDLNLQWKYISPSIERFLGYNLDELKQLTLDNFLTEQSLKSALDTYKSELPKNMVSRETIPYKVFLELECRGKDGQTIWIECTFSFIRDEIGKPISLLGEGREISKRKLAEKALKKSEERYRRVFENAGLPMVIMEDSLVIFMVNDRFVEMSGYKKDEIEGLMKFTDFIFPEDRETLMECFAAGKGDEPVEYECRIAHRSGEKFDILIRLGYISGAGQFIASFTDITSRKQAELALLESKEHLQKENIRLRSSIRERYRFCDIIGKSPVMQEVYEFILQAAETLANVIIYGESGTGKELVAKAIHETSDRSQKGFVTVHCGAIPETLMESEFFGYKKGAFTGANMDKRGYLDEAHSGTLFLDEVGDIGQNMQVKLLRAISGDGYTPVGSNTIKNADVRIIAATNRNLRDLVKKGVMREDFFYRIHILPIYLPPLRDRKDDLPLLVDHFLQLQDKKHPALPGHIVEALLNYDWPGNIRELQNVLHRYLTLKRLDFAGMPITRLAQQAREAPKNGNSIRTDFAPGIYRGDQAHPDQSPGDIRAKEPTMNLKTIERDNIMRALSEHNWHRGQTASALGISRRTLFRKMQKLSFPSP